MVITNKMSIIDWLYKIFVNGCAVLLLHLFFHISIGFEWTSIWNVKIVSFVIALLVVYVYNYLVFCNMTLYDDYIELKFPMRFTHRTKIIKYNHIRKVAFTVPMAGMGYRIYTKDVLWYFISVDVYETANIRNTLSFFYKKGVSIHFYSNESKRKYASWS